MTLLELIANVVYVSVLINDYCLLMKLFFRYNALIVIGCIVVLSCSRSPKAGVTTNTDSAFTFAFMSDIHLQPELNATTHFQNVIDTVNKLKTDFVLTGGDLVKDALAVKQSRADSLFTLYTQEIKSFNVPVYNAIGNHDVFGIYKESGVSSDNTLFGKKMYEKYIGKRYYWFEHKGWKFFILDVIDVSEPGKYKGNIDSVQLAWLKNEVAKTPVDMPLVVACHIPLLTTLPQFENGALTPNTEGLVVENSKQILDAFAGHNLKLVLQGHLHILESVYIGGVQFIIDGAVSGKWWNGPNMGTKEGFVLLTMGKKDFSWKYIEYKI